MDNEQQNRIDLVVIGQGYVGLPLAQEASSSGLKVVGFDVNPGLVRSLNAGISHIDDLSDEDISTMRLQGYEASADPEVLSRADTIVVCVPTPLSKDGSPDMKYVESAAATVARHITRGTLVSLESTTYPGTTDGVLKPLMEEQGFTVGEDVYLAFSPERINPGDPIYGFRNTPKVLGGVTPACTKRAEEFYGKIVDRVVPVSGPKEAEMTKLLENTYRHVNIALVNELAKACRGLGIDLHEVVDAAKTKPFGFQAFYPGPGVGGHCIPIDPNYLSFTIKTELGSPFRFVELAQEINESMPRYVRDRIAEELNNHRKPIAGSNVLLLGVTYKPDIADQRESPAVPLGKLLFDSGADLCFHDPKVERWAVSSGVSLQCVDELDRAIAEADIVVLLQNHASYMDLDFSAVSAPVLDTRGVLKRTQNVTGL